MIRAFTFVEEHVTDSGSLFVDFERMSCQNDTLRNYAVCVIVERCPHCD
jgi:hypothetical protein